MSYADDMGYSAYDGDDFLEDELRMNRIMMRQIQGYYHYNESMGRVDVREIDSNYAGNLYRWYLRRARDEEQVIEMKNSTMLKELRSKFEQ